uniref:Secreted peptide n=1 Tax=Anopheles braziliensis TaxID=58242 RepID=A0A2M3ZLG2_9DIPT
MLLLLPSLSLSFSPFACIPHVLGFDCVIWLELIKHGKPVNPVCANKHVMDVFVCVCVCVCVCVSPCLVSLV